MIDDFEECTCIALYDLDISYTKDPIHLKGLFTYIEKWFIEHGILPERMSLSGLNVPKSSKTRTFKYYKNILEKNQFQGVEDLWIGSTPGNNGTDILDAQVVCSLKIKNEYTAFFIYFQNRILPNDWGYVKKFVSDLSLWIKSGYGIAFQRDFNRGPGWYVHGMIAGSNKYVNSKDPLLRQEHDNISKWLHTYGDPLRRHLGDLRDIYPLNFLSKEHLERSVGDKTLKTWIESSPDHGTLAPLTDQLWSWSVPEDQISSVREALRPTGFVICI